MYHVIRPSIRGQPEEWRYLIKTEKRIERREQKRHLPFIICLFQLIRHPVVNTKLDSHLILGSTKNLHKEVSSLCHQLPGLHHLVACFSLLLRSRSGRLDRKRSIQTSNKRVLLLEMHQQPLRPQQPCPDTLKEVLSQVAARADTATL